MSLIWHLLSISLKVLSLPWNSGSLVSWTESSMGCELLYNIFCELRHSNRWISLAAVTCVLGGSEYAANLLRPCIEKCSFCTSKLCRKGETGQCDYQRENVKDWQDYLEKVIGWYVTVLSQQGAAVKCVEVSFCFLCPFIILLLLVWLPF